MSAESCLDATSCEWFHWEERVTNRCAVHGDLGDESFEEHQTILAKRFTDTELAAEFWRSRQRWTNGLYTNLYATEVDGDARAYTFRQITRMTVEAQTMERFATLPHYDEVTA